MITVADILRDMGVKLTREAEGQHYATCPKCSHLRKPQNRRKPCLSVVIDGPRHPAQLPPLRLSGRAIL
jgi:hypothetical protein